MKFVRLTEDNDWEGETWHFYLQLDGNEELLEKLRIEINRVFTDAEPLPFTMDDQVFDEALVDEFVKIPGRSTYMSEHNKVTGKFEFDFSELDRVKKYEDYEWEFYQQALYKGGIKDYFKE